MGARWKIAIATNVGSARSLDTGRRDHVRHEIKTGMHSGEQPVTEITPEYKIDGDLTGFGVISGQSVHRITKGGLPGTLNVQYTLSPFPPIPVEMRRTANC